MDFEKLKTTIICHNCGGLGKTLDTKNGMFIPCNVENCIDGFIDDSEIKPSRREISDSINNIELFYSDEFK